MAKQRIVFRAWIQRKLLGSRISGQETIIWTGGRRKTSVVNFLAGKPCLSGGNEADLIYVDLVRIVAEHYEIGRLPGVNEPATSSRPIASADQVV